MSADKKKAVARLATGECTCVLVKDERVWESRERGVKPLMDLLRAGVVPRDAAAADRVVGRAAAFLYVLLGVRSLHASVVSRPALEVLYAHGIETTYETLTDAIINRQGTGFCPAESAVLDVTDPTLVPAILCEKLGVQ